MINENEVEGKLTNFAGEHFYKLYALSIVLFLIVAFHHAFTFFPHPVIINAKTGESIVTYKYTYTSRYGERHTDYLKAPQITFEYQNKKYTIVGGTDELKGPDIDTRIIFSADNPQGAAELSILGLLDFPLAKNAFYLWLFISGSIFAFASADDHIVLFNFRIRKLSKLSFAAIGLAIFLLPLYQYSDLLLFGKVTDSVMTGDSDFCDGQYYYIISYHVDGAEFKSYNDYLNENSEFIGKHFPLLYLSGHPERSSVYTFMAMYSNSYVIFVIMLMISLAGWMYASSVGDE